MFEAEITSKQTLLVSEVKGKIAYLYNDRGIQVIANVAIGCMLSNGDRLVVYADSIENEEHLASPDDYPKVSGIVLDIKRSPVCGRCAYGGKRNNPIWPACPSYPGRDIPNAPGCLGRMCSWFLKILGDNLDTCP